MPRASLALLLPQEPVAGAAAGARRGAGDRQRSGAGTRGCTGRGRRGRRGRGTAGKVGTGGGTGTLPAAPVPEPPQTGARQAATSPSTSATTPPPWRAPRPPSPSPCASPARRRRCPTAAWCGARTAPSTVSAPLTPPAPSLVGAVATPVPRSASGPRRHPRHAGRPRLPGAAGRGLGRRLPRRAALSPQRLGQARKIRLRVVDVG